MGADITPSDRAVVIAGPTASGKSALALALAERFGGVVINADSMQVYRDLHLLTARPSDEDMARAPHRLFGHVDAAETYSVGRWLGEVRVALADAQVAGLRPIVVGGTGLYLKALTQGLSAIPAVPPAVRTAVRAWAEGRAPQDLHAELLRRDPEMARRLRPTDPQRIVRALEVVEATGRSLAEFQETRDRPLLATVDVVAVRLSVDRVHLREAIDRRFDAMMAQGGLAEADRLSRRQLDPTLPALRALGVPPLLAHLQGGVALAEAVARSKTLTRQYAKRQVTFAQHQLPDFSPLSGDAAAAYLAGCLG